VPGCSTTGVGAATDAAAWETLGLTTIGM